MTQDPVPTKSYRTQDVVQSYYRVRQTLGYLGFCFPFLLIFMGLLSNAQLEPSVSDFFHTLTRDVYVGILFAISIFLMVYDGYEREPGEWFSDNWITTVAGVAGLGVALFPNESPDGSVATLTQQALGVGISPIIHYSSCLVFFYCMGHICMFKFSKTTTTWRRRVYLTSGWIITFSGTFVGLTSYLKHTGSPELRGFIVDQNVVFWIEAIGVWAFSFSWLVKGKGDKALLSKRFLS